MSLGVVYGVLFWAFVWWRWRARSRGDVTGPGVADDGPRWSPTRGGGF